MHAFEVKTCSDGWYAAARFLSERADWRAYNLILNVNEPGTMGGLDHVRIERLDKLLQRGERSSVCTVANTIFPMALYQNHGNAGVYERYNKLWPSLSKLPQNRRGTYARRILYRKGPDGKVISPLKLVVERLKNAVGQSNPKRAAYEMGVVDPFADLPVCDPALDKSIMGFPCLSHLSFKIDDGGALMLTAIYRSQYYISRALGNLVGLAWLQHFVAAETGIPTGSLVCIATMAVLDTLKSEDGGAGWTRDEVRQLVADQ